MKKLLALPIILTFAQCASAQIALGFTMTNAASLTAGPVAPGSIAAIKGTNLTTEVSSAHDALHPPTTLDGVTVTVGGISAGLFYVSPTQINLVVDPSTPLGSQAVVVTSGSGTQNGTVTIDTNAPPGLFSLFGTGTRDGAILNAVTFLLGDFSTQTLNSPTYLALFATGLNTSTTPTVTIGGVPVTVVFAGPTPCCDGLEQVNVKLPASLAGAGRVPVVLSSNGQTSNTVQVVLLPPTGMGPFSDDRDNHTRSRELSSLAAIPGTSLALSADQNDDVVRVIDLSAKMVTHVITLPEGARPVSMAVNDAGTLAVVAESNRGKVAILDLTNFAVVTEVATDLGPNAVAIGGTQAVVVNGDVDSVSVIDLTNNTVQKTIPVGHGPEAVAVDTGAKLAYVVNEDDGSVSIVDLAGLAVTKTLSLGASLRPESIALVPGAGVAYLTVPAAGPDGQVLLLDLTSGKTTSTSANPSHTGGSGAVLVNKSDVYFANQTGGSISVLPIDPNTGVATGPIQMVKVDLGARALALDAKDGLLVVSNEGSGTLVLVDLTSLTVTARINAVRTNLEGDDDTDDHSDRDAAANRPIITSLTPSSGKADGSSFTLTIAGQNLTGATSVVFQGIQTSSDDSDEDDDSHLQSDGAIAVTNVQPSADGTQVTATVAIATSAKPGPRIVRVITPNGSSSFRMSMADVFTVTQ